MDVTTENVATVEDTDVLWTALTAAKADGDHALVRGIENRMRELSTERRFAHLSDEELLAQLAGLLGGREQGTSEMIGHSPATAGGATNDDAPALTLLNNGIRENQSVGINRTLGALRDELQRRGLDDEARRQA